MSDIENNKRIVKNTLVLYFRMLLTILVSLYTSRIVLNNLGIEDFGIYNVVGGVVMMFSFLNSSMVSSTQRYLNYELGRGDKERLKKVFSIALNIHFLLAFIIIILAETIGLWFVNNQLVIPDNRIIAANYVYQFSIFTFFINIIQAPYNAAIIAHERMNIYAYISILEVLLKLCIAYLLIVTSYDRLVFYAILCFALQLLIRLIYQVYCKRKYEECNYQFVVDKQLFKEMSSFAGWNLFGSMAWLLKDQGVNILLNLFFGPLINAARGVAMQVSNAVMGLVGNFQVALNPQITKHYANGQIDQMELLTYRGAKFSYILLWMISLPLILNIDFILNLWLVDVPDYSGYFIILILLEAMFSTLYGNTFITSLQATGKIKVYQMVVSAVLFFIVPISYFAFKFGLDAPAIFYISMVITLLAGMLRFYFCKTLLGYSIGKFMNYVFIPIFIMTLLSFPVPLIFRMNVFYNNTFVDFFAITLLCFICVLFFAWIIGLTKNERSSLILMINKKINK